VTGADLPRAPAEARARFGYMAQRFSLYAQLAVLGSGICLALTSLARTQQQALLHVFASPIIVLSGFAAPIENIPPIVELIDRFDPVRYMLVTARGLFLHDMPVRIVLEQAWPMALITLLTVAGFAARRALS
jgi:ABC-2 type transport system permease protein